MKLKQLKLHGFKSFADRTELQFHEGITAIVGPNGCGKSNISDAIRWVLGEQRASAIRSSKMEEAIFQGTTKRRAVNRAEVALTFSNEDGRLAVPYDEIEIRRTVYREGGSDYELNRSACRLKDILDLCRDTGLGANAYAIIEQGMVDAILSSRADDRRQLFEEAAGIGRYKDRRKAALRRLQSAEADLTRLEDVISEVESKVRSLARQRRRAQRYEEMRAKRLSLEVAVANAELAAIQETLEQITGRLAELERDVPAARAALQTAETELENHRLRTTEIARARSGAASRLEAVNRRIADRERELAVADERRAHAERRLAQIGTERRDLHARIEELEAEAEQVEEQRAGQREEVAALEVRVREVQERQQALRTELAEVRRADEETRRRVQDLGRRLAELEASAAGADARADDMERRLEKLDAEEAELEAQFARLDEQGDLFADRARELAGERERLEAERSATAAELKALKDEEDEARQRLIAAEERANRLSAQVAALDALERDYHGFAPVVADVLAARDELTGRIEPLAEFLRLPPERAAAVEGALGSLLQVLVLDDDAAIEELRRWLDTERSEEGTLALLPREALPRVEGLLDALEFVGQPPSEPTVLGRRERLKKLRAEAASAAEERDRCVQLRAEAGEKVAAAESRLRDIAGRLQSLKGELEQMDADEAARAGRRSRVQQAHQELIQQREALRAAIEQARAEAAAARQQHAALEAERAAHQESRSETERRREAQEEAWDAVRNEEAEVRVAHARAEGTLTELDRRHAAARAGIEGAQNRLEALDREEKEHRATLEELQGLHTDAGADLEQLFGERDALAAELSALDEQLAEAEEAAKELENQVRTLRRSVEESGNEQHRMELKRAEAESARRSIRERLEAEWNRPFEQLVEQAEPMEGELDALRGELQVVTADLQRLGPVNMLAIEQHEEEKRRLDFLRGQREDLLSAKDDLQTAIRQINRTARQQFMETFEQVRENFQRTFHSLFQGGECDVWLADPEHPLESDIEISASPRGKRTQRIHLLSGGERALTSLALLFAIYLVKPSPFCVMDEVDAPLDESNIDRFLRMVEEFKSDTQFIIITHNPRTIAAADWIYGVTMEDPGVSSIVGVRLEEVVPEAAAGAAS